MANLRTMRALCKEQRNYTENDIRTNMAEVRSIILSSANRIYRGDNIELNLITTVVNEYEGCLKKLLGLEVL